MTSAPSPKDQQKRKPSFTAPALSCDAHCHVFGPAAVFPYAPDRRYTPQDAPKEALAALHERLGLERAVIVQASCHGTDNRAMLDAIAWRPDSYRGVAIVDDTFDDTALQALHDGGVRGVRFNFVKHLGGAPDMALFGRVIDRIKGCGWHVVLHLDAVDIVPLSDMIRRLPVPFVIDHMGRVETALGTQQPAFQSLLELARREDCWVKVCGSERISRYPFDAAIPFARALVEVSPERTLWGTDFPHPNLKEPVDEADLLDLVARIAPSGEERQRLLVDNPARLYGFTT
ncbi:Amidohydrolase 2 [Pseudorhizobium banfieldiae]|uniref:Amidohydrolase 2 n=1 Tax=Pseudorhizobium banfieldiae TaxID=1125847 RepID=L0NDS6_9HYPH|nr:amidohydrolase family protein [Pseudorhizobium banfieldiae]CAD6605524.1 2-pyrone-4,6-dicarboxylate hydrolase [arsenite-oxidising bacterium NT-25]CCF19034.1 Amidohydrolase 2 [Pseudorhizobium banfieldiae]